MNRTFYTIHLLLTVLLLCLWGCSAEEVTPPSQQPVAIAFDSYIQSSRQGTRATYPTEAEGTMDLDKLKTQGFGVFAQYTGDKIWSTYTKTVPFNFMWNQAVDWTDPNWTYTPVKYWPNDNQHADDQGATGSQTHSYLQFFGYAPKVEPADLPGTLDAGGVLSDAGGPDDLAEQDGIIAMTANTVNADASCLYYRTSLEKPFDPDESVDLLWAKAQDRYKYDDTSDAADDGRVSDKVDLLFKHALSLFTVTVQGLFDHKDNDDVSTLYPDDRDIYTKILIESVDFSGSPLFSAGKMYLAPQPADATVPHWVLDDSDGDDADTAPDYKTSISVIGQDVNPTFWNRYLDGTYKPYWDESDMSQGLLKETDVNEDGVFDATDALALFNQLPMGVSHTEVPLNYTAYDEETGKYADYYYMVLPNDEYRATHSTEKMTVRMVYYVITYDERLTLVNANRPKFFSIVKNDITATFDTFSFAPNKKYKLRLQPGLTTVKFEVTMVDGWDTPLTLDPEVVDWYTTTTEFNVE